MRNRIVMMDINYFFLICSFAFYKRKKRNQKEKTMKNEKLFVLELARVLSMFHVTNTPTVLVCGVWVREIEYKNCLK